MANDRNHSFKVALLLCLKRSFVCCTYRLPEVESRYVATEIYNDFTKGNHFLSMLTQFNLNSNAAISGSCFCTIIYIIATFLFLKCNTVLSIETECNTLKPIEAGVFQRKNNGRNSEMIGLNGKMICPLGCRQMPTSS